MKIIAIVRTRDEEKNIGRFCRAYAWADKILVADVGSDDNTVKIAQYYPNVEVRYFTEQVEGKNGLWRSGEGKHWNFLIDWAKTENPDWILHDDCDCVPNEFMQQRMRELLQVATDANQKVALAYRIYMWGTTQYFPDLNKAGQSLYGFTSDSGIRFDETDPWNVNLVSYEPLKSVYKFQYPYVLLHYFCPDPETVDMKMKFYRESGQQPDYRHPLQSCGSLANIEPWMV